MTRLAEHGLVVSPPPGWEGEIYRRDPVPAGPLRGAGVPTPVVHLANFSLPADRGDFGGGAVELMGRGEIFIALLEHDPAEAASALFRARGVPWPLRPDDFGPRQMQRPLPGQSGCQRFFTVSDRAFCLYVALGSHRMRSVFIADVNAALATVEID